MRARQMITPTTTPTTIPAIAPPLRPESEPGFAFAASVWVASGEVVDDDVVDEVEAEEVAVEVVEGDAVSVVHVYEFWKTGPELLLSSSPPPPEEELSWSIAAHVAEPVVTIEDWPLTCSSLLKERLS
jgi:hypothetical protein